MNARPEEMDVPETTRAWRCQLIDRNVLRQLWGIDGNAVDLLDPPALLTITQRVKSSRRPNIGMRYWNFGDSAPEQALKKALVARTDRKHTGMGNTDRFLSAE